MASAGRLRRGQRSHLAVAGSRAGGHPRAGGQAQAPPQHRQVV